jgi:hypothetical protein
MAAGCHLTSDDLLRFVSLAINPMSTLSLPTLMDTAETDLAFPTQLVPATDHPVRRQVWNLLAGLHPPGQWVERRFEQRFPYPQLLYLTPLADDGASPGGDSIIVVGKHLSESGLSFFHQRPLAHRRMIASLEERGRRWVGFVIDISWCRFTQHGWYDSGGQFLEAVPSPIRTR